MSCVYPSFPSQQWPVKKSDLIVKNFDKISDVQEDINSYVDENTKMNMDARTAMWIVNSLKKIEIPRYES